MDLSNINAAGLWESFKSHSYTAMRAVEGWLESILHINITWELLGLCALGAVTIGLTIWLGVMAWRKTFYGFL